MIKYFKWVNDKLVLRRKLYKPSRHGYNRLNMSDKERKLMAENLFRIKYSVKEKI